MIEFTPETIQVLAEEAGCSLDAAEAALTQALNICPVEENEPDFQEKFVALYEQALKLLQ